MASGGLQGAENDTKCVNVGVIYLDAHVLENHRKQRINQNDHRN